MKIKINKNLLIKKLSTIIKVASNNNSIASNTCVLIYAKNSSIELIATNSLMSMKTEIKIDKNLLIERTGKILVNCDYLLSIVKKIDDEIIKLESIEENILNIQVGNFKSELNCFEVSKFPKINFQIKGEKTEIDSEIFLNIVNNSSFIINQKEKRQILKGYNFKKISDYINVTTTDSFRMSFNKIDTKENKITFEKTIPSEFIDLIKSIIVDNKKNTIHFYFNDTNVIVNFDDTIIQSKVIIGNYPNAKEIIPKTFNTSLIINKELIRKAIERVSTLSTRGFENNILTMEVKKNKLFFYTNINQIVKSSEMIENFELKGEEQKISVNSRYILDSIKSFSSKKIEINIIDAYKPLIIKDLDKDNSKQLILPIRTY